MSCIPDGLYVLQKAQAYQLWVNGNAANAGAAFHPLGFACISDVQQWHPINVIDVIGFQLC